jgi:hypothetical protein
MGKSGLGPFFQEHFLKPTGFWEMLERIPIIGYYYKNNYGDY